MADTIWMFLSRAPSIEFCHAQLEKKIKGQEKFVTTCCLVLLAVLFMFVFGNTLMRGSSMQYHTTWQQQTLTPVPNSTRAQRRVLLRVMSFMAGQCRHNDVVFGPQITLDSIPYAHSIAVFCKHNTFMCDPQVVRHGNGEITCMDEHNSKTKLKRRKAPVSISTTCGKTANFTDHKDVCVAWHVLDMLNSRW